MTIKIGDSLPNNTLKQITSEGFKDVNIKSLCEGKTVVIFGVPGAFTPPCTFLHLPGFNNRMNDFSTKNIQVICIAVNDPFVLKAWAEATNSHKDIIFLSDWDAAFTKAIGLEVDASVAALGLRSHRYSMILKNGIVETLNVEPSPLECTVTSADHALEIL